MGKRTGVLLLLLIVAAWQMAGCETMEMKSAWQGSDIPANTDVGNWPGNVTKLGDGKVTLTASNNGDFLYLALAVNDLEGDIYSQYAKALGTNGLTVWLDPQGADQKFFGIRFLESAARGSDDLELVDSKGVGFPTNSEALQSFGFYAVTSASENNFSCVLKIPLKAKDQNFFPAVFATSTAIGVNIEGLEPKGRSSVGAGGGKHHGGRHGGGQQASASSSPGVTNSTIEPANTGTSSTTGGFNGAGISGNSLDSNLNGNNSSITPPSGVNPAGGGEPADSSDLLNVGMKVDLASGQGTTAQ
jgi:hypothetical protein